MRSPAVRSFARSFAPALICIVALGACHLSYTGGAKPVTSAELVADTALLRAAPTPIVTQQSRADCGLAALAMVAGAWGRTWTVTDMARELAPTPSGVKLGALRDYARNRGLDAYAIKGTFADLATELRAGRPVLLGLVLPYDQNNNLHHYEVVVAMDPSGRTVITRDPATGDLMRRSHEVLDVEWKTAGYATLVIVGETTPVNSVRKPSGDDHVQAIDLRDHRDAARFRGMQ